MRPYLNTLHFRSTPIDYTGSQLSPHWIYRTFDLMGDSIVCFHGKADVPLIQMVDLEDVKKQAPIYSPAMLHFVGEWFWDNFDTGILLQHLLSCEIYEGLLERGIKNLTRRGNDLYFEQRKLSVSVATRSPVSVLVHMGINIETNGTPIPTSGLVEMGVDPIQLGSEILERFKTDFMIWRRARVKVIPR